MLSKKFLIAVFFVFISGCALNKPTPTPQQLLQADYGLMPSKAVFKRHATEMLSNTLYDPLSLIYYEPTSFKKYWASDDSGTFFYGYYGTYAYNAKNRLGGYVGKKYGAIFMRNNVPLQYYDINENFFFLTPSDNTITGTIAKSTILAINNNNLDTASPETKADIQTENLFSRAKLQELEPKKSTIEDAKKLFGEPNSFMSKGSYTVLQWSKVRDGKSAIISIIFDVNSKMIKVFSASYY
jgi:hypothetical protein